MILDHVKQIALNNSLFPKTSLTKAFDRMGFIQADPIRSPARAQDLILRHRVKNYKNGELEKIYPKLDLDEDFLYAYGFLTCSLRSCLYPRTLNSLTDLDHEILAHIRESGEKHPKDLAEKFGSHTEINSWGGTSKATKRSLERLHYHGHLRISRRIGGIKLYEAWYPQAKDISEDERRAEIILSIVRILGPVAETTLTKALYYMRYFIGDFKAFVAALINKGTLERIVVDKTSYIFIHQTNTGATGRDGNKKVKFLAPFDPLVWDRLRFEHLWGWRYRFEAYTPKEKRIRGYYAMPVLWGKEIIGWVNISTKGGKIDIEDGYICSRPDSKQFKISFEEEVSSMAKFLLGP